MPAWPNTSHLLFHSCMKRWIHGSFVAPRSPAACCLTPCLPSPSSTRHQAHSAHRCLRVGCPLKGGCLTARRLSAWPHTHPNCPALRSAPPFLTRPRSTRSWTPRRCSSSSTTSPARTSSTWCVEECGAGAGYCGWGWLARAQQRRQRGGKVGTLCCPSARCNALAPCPAAGGAGAEAAGLALPQAALGLVPGAPGPVGGAQREAVPATCLTSQPLLRFPSTLCDASPPLCVPGLLPWRSGTRSPRRAASQATTGSRARECGPGPVLPLLCPGSLKWQVAYWLLAWVCSLPPGVSAACALPPTLNHATHPHPPLVLPCSYVYFDSSLADEAGSGWCYRLKQNFLVRGVGGQRRRVEVWCLLCVWALRSLPGCLLPARRRIHTTVFSPGCSSSTMRWRTRVSDSGALHMKQSLLVGRPFGSPCPCLAAQSAARLPT